MRHQGIEFTEQEETVLKGLRHASTKAVTEQFVRGVRYSLNQLQTPDEVRQFHKVSEQIFIALSILPRNVEDKQDLVHDKCVLQTILIRMVAARLRQVGALSVAS